MLGECFPQRLRETHCVRLVAVQTLNSGGELVVDARVPAMAVAGVLVWRRAPFLVVVFAAAGTAALLRLLA